MARSRDFIDNGGWEKVDTSTSNNLPTSPPGQGYGGQEQPTYQTYQPNGGPSGAANRDGGGDDKETARRKWQFIAIYLDAASVGFDQEKYKALTQSGAGLSQMSDAERDFITTRYQATNPYSRQAYTDSVTDKYLAAFGMPSSKELTKYRQAYYDYASGGGVRDNYANLDDDAYRYIKGHWRDGLQTGIDGRLYTAKGKAVEYKDTLLDDQLKAADLPPSSMMNDYFLDYQSNKAVDAEIKDFYAAVYEKASHGTPSEEAYRTTLEDPKYRHLIGYVSEAIAYPKEAEYTDNDPVSPTYGQMDKGKDDAAWEKAVAADAKRDALDHRVSYDDYERFAAGEMQRQRWEKYDRDYRASQEKAQKWMTTPAKTEDERAQRSADIKKYLGLYRDGTTMADMSTYFGLLDAGVPYETINKGYAAVNEWLEGQTDDRAYADVKLLLQGYSKDDGDYETNKEVVRQTRMFSGSSEYEKYKDFDIALLGKHSVGHQRVSSEGAIYAEVNGVRHAPAEFSESSDLQSLYAFASNTYSDGKRMSDYMTAEEKGVFNYLFRTNVAKSMEYLGGLRGMIEDRRYVDQTASFAVRMATDGVNVSDSEVADYVYDALLYEYDQELESDAEDWHAQAWRKYAGYSDKKLKELAAEADVDPTLHGPNEAQWVLDTRAYLRKSANVEASLRDYTEAAGKAATTEHDYTGEIGHSADNLIPATHYGTDSFIDTLAYFMNGGWNDVNEQPIVAQMTDDQKDRYNWLYKNKGQEAAQAYYASIRSGLDTAASAKVKAENKTFGKEHKALATVLSVPGTFMSGIMGVGGTVLNLATGTELTRTQAATWNTSNTWREGVSEDWGKGGQFAYGTVMSMADSGVTAVMAAMGVPPAVGTALLATSAYTSTLDAALDRGLDAKSAYRTAVVAGVAEWITEEIGLETLLKGIDSLRKGAKTSLTKEFFKNVAKQAFIEGSEEVNSDIINFVYDNLANMDMSEFNQNVSRLVDAGYSKEEAREIAWKNQCTELFLSFAGGAISGGVMAGAGGWFRIKPALLDRAYGDSSSQAGASANASAQTGASVHAHADTYAKGRAVVDRIFGQHAGNNILYAMDNRENADDAKRIDAISERLLTLDNTNDLYGYIHDADGNLTLTDDERVALASALAMGYSDTNADNIDAAFIHAMASTQEAGQRQANTNYDRIKTAQEVRNVNDQIAKTQQAISNIETEQATKLADAKNAFAAAMSEVDAITKKLMATTDIKEKNALLASQKTAQDKADNLKARLNTVKGADANDAKARIKAAKEEIARQQTLLDQHYASASAFLNEYAPNAFAGGAASRASANARMADIGAKIDAIMSSDMSDSDKTEALAPLHDQLASAGASLRAINARLDNANPSALTNAMNAIKSGTVADFIRAQSETAQKAADSAQTSNAEESSSDAENGEGAPSEGVKQDDAARRYGKNKAEHVIGARVQKTFDRIAKKFGCEIVWGNDSTAIGETGLTLQGRNGAYNPAEPNRIYLNTTMVADKSITSTQAVAREFFTHEIVHYIANTKTYGKIVAHAARYYNVTLGKGGADMLISGIIADEHERGNTSFGKKQATEEMAAHFAQEVLFAGTDGNRRALVWLTRTDSGMIGNWLNVVEYLIKRGNVRKASDGNAVKTMLIDAEYELINALKERQYLDRNGKTSAFQGSSNTQAKASGDVANSRQGMDIEDYAKEATVRIDDDTELARLIDNRGNASVGSVISDYIMNVFGGQTITMSDGREVIVDRHDAKKLSQYPKPRKTAEISNMRRIIDAARYDHSVHTDSHRKFTDFYYYVGNVLYNDVLYGVELSVGTAKNDKTSHLYDIRDWNKNGTAGSSETNSPMPGQATGVSNTSGSFDGSITAVPGSVKPSDSVTPTETVSDVRNIYTGKGEGHSDVMNSRGTTVEDYLPLDYSKNRILQEDGTPYPVLYSGTQSAGHTVFDPAYGDDGLTTWLTNKMDVAQSYARESSSDPLAPEYDPYIPTGRRKKIGTRAKYYDVSAQDNGALFNILDWQAHGDLSMLAEEERYFINLAPEVVSEWGDAGIAVQQALKDARALYDMLERLATTHDDIAEAVFFDTFDQFSDTVDSLMDDAHNSAMLDRGNYSYEDFANDAVSLDGEALYYHVAELARFRTAVADAVIDSGIFETLQNADPNGGKRFLGFDSAYKGVAKMYSQAEADSRMPEYSKNNGVYKLKPYGENPLVIDVNGAWNMIDVLQLPDDIRQQLADLYGWGIGYSTRNIARAVYEQGDYDSIIFRNIMDMGVAANTDSPSDVIVTYQPYQQKSIYNMSPTTNPDIRFSTGMSIDDYIQRYGQKEQNAFGSANNIRTPNYVDNDAGRRFRVPDTAQTLKEVAHIRQSARDVIDEGILQQADGVLERHGLVYEPVSLDRMRELGQRYIAEHGGLTQAMRDLTRDMPRARQNELVQYMSAANQVFTEIGAEGTFDPHEYYEFVASYVEMRSNWGRVGRAMQLVNDSPLGRVAYWQRVVQRINEKNSEAVSRGLNPLFYRNGAAEIEVPQAFFDTLAQARNQEEIDAAEYAITQYIGQNSPLTVSDALRNWRYFAMLANPVTHMRNLLGNTAMLGGRVVKDTIAAGMENAAVRMGLMGADERTHAVVLGQDADTRAFVRQLWEDNANAVQSGGRDGFQQTLDDARRKSPIRAIDAAMRFNTNGVENSNNPFLRYVGLEKEDLLFLQTTFTAAAAQYIQAQGIDVRNITRQQRGAIVNYATQQAQEATYRDASKLADALNQFAKSGWGAQLFIDAIVPFKKTPVNIFKRGIEYSPAGLARGLIDIGRNAVARSKGRQPSVRASVVVDELAKGLTGSMLALLGFFLSRAGILKVKAGDDDKDSAFERDIGRQDYSLEIGDVSVKIESLAPLTFPLFMGAQLQRLTSTEHDGLSLSDLAESAAKLADPLMDMSFMSSLNDVLSTYNENKLGGVAVNAAQSYLGQYIPTIGAKLNQTINTQRRTSKASQASPVGTSMDYWLRSMASKIPGVNQAVLEPYVTTTGEYDEKSGFGDYALAIINNFVSPVNVQIVDTSPVNKEIARLVTVTGSTDFVPQNPKKYLTIKSERYNMTAKEYTQYSKEHNETVYAVLTQVIQSQAYARATDEQRAEMLKKAYDRAHKTVMDKYKSIFAQK